MNKIALSVGTSCLAVIASAGVSMAQPSRGYYSQPPPQGYYGQTQNAANGFNERAGHLIAGVSLGFGGMSVDDKSVKCNNCSSNPVAFSASANIGGMLSNQLGLMLELQANSQTVSELGNNTIFLTQTAAMIAAQYWVSPRLWIKGGVGFANLSNTDSNSDAQLDIGSGGAALIGAGYELVSNQRMAVDLQGRFVIGSYDGINSKTSSGTVGVGINWF
jgi:hypothetical protein